jgi:hypothetical protein
LVLVPFLLCLGCGSSDADDPPPPGGDGAGGATASSTGAGGDTCVAPSVFYRDGDGDGFGSDETTEACSAPDGWTDVDGDCDDALAEVNPDAAEVCNVRDDDCDGEIDVDAVDATDYYVDSDGDGFGDPATLQRSCDPVDDAITTGGDCNDDYDLAYPGAPEICDGTQNDCAVPWNNDHIVTFTPLGGTPTDVSTTFASGTQASPYDEIWEESGTFTFCGGTYFVYITSRAEELHLEGQGTTETVLSGGGVSRVFFNQEVDAVVTMQDLTIADAYGCYGAAIASRKANSCSPQGASAGIEHGWDLTLTNVHVRDSINVRGEGVVSVHYGSLTLIDSAIYDNEGSRTVHLDDAGFVCDASGPGLAGVWRNGGRGVQIDVTDFGAPLPVSLTGCDFGEAADANAFYDFVIDKWIESGDVYLDLGSDVTMTCDTTVASCTAG